MLYSSWTIAIFCLFLSLIVAFFLCYFYFGILRSQGKSNRVADIYSSKRFMQMCVYSKFQSFGLQLWQRAAASKSHHQRTHSVEIDSGKIQDELDQIAAPPAADTNFQHTADAGVSPSSSLEVQDTSPNEQCAKEEWAAIRIQTAFRGFLVLTPLFHPFARLD